MLPIKTTIEDFDTLSTYLKTQVGWVPLERVRKTLDAKYSDNRKLEAQRRVGFIERDGVNVKLTDRGRAYASSSDPSERVELMQAAIREVPLYVETIDWIHYSRVDDPDKTTVGNYWHDKHQDQIEGAKGAALTDAVIFFMRLADAAGLGTFTRGSGKKPESYLKSNKESINSFVESKQTSSTSHSETPDTDRLVGSPSDAVDFPEAATTVPTPKVSLGTSPAIHVNLEIHIAANATAETVAEIFKNMRKYVLSNPSADDIS